MSIILLATIRAANAQAAETIKKQLEAIRDVALNKEVGTKQYQTTRGIDNPLEFAIFEEYESKEAMGAHMASKEFLALKDGAADNFDGGFEKGATIKLYTKF